MNRDETIRIAVENAQAGQGSLEAISACSAELGRAIRQHPPMRGPHEGYAVILEELDELWDEIKCREINQAAMRNEAIQLAAMAMRFVMDVCGHHNSTAHSPEPRATEVKECL